MFNILKQLNTNSINGLKFGFFQNFNKNIPRYSCETLKPIYNEIIKSTDYNKHETIFFAINGEESYWAFIHNTNRGLTQGGARLMDYESIENLINDGLRLSKGMSYKNALADLNWGGGKAIIYSKNKNYDTLKNFGQFISTLDGCYYTAEDMNLGTEDMDIIHKYTRYITCLSRDIGGSGNPSYYTANGVVSALDQVLRQKKVDYTDITVGIEGVGNVGSHILKFILDRNPKSIYIQDNDPNKLNMYLDMPNIFISNNIIKENIDVYMPCARGGTINKNTINDLNNTIICGAANNQLENDSYAQILHDNKSTYIPDYLINRMGIVNCADETLGYLEDDYLINRHFDINYKNSIPAIVSTLFEEQNNENNLDKIYNLSEYMVSKKNENSERAKLIMTQVCRKILESKYVERY